MSTSEVVELDLDQIRTDGDTQSRIELDQPTVDEYAEALDRGDVFPPVEVAWDGEHYWLWDGFHRWYAHKQAGRMIIEAVVSEGSCSVARWKAAHANQIHGLKRTNHDKQRSILLALRALKEEPAILGGAASYSAIAQHCGVDHKTVAAFVRENPSWELPKIRPVKRGDQNYTMDTSNISRKTDNVEKVKELLRQELTIREIEKQTGVPRSTIQDIKSRMSSESRTENEEIRTEQTPTPDQQTDVLEEQLNEATAPALSPTPQSEEHEILPHVWTRAESEHAVEYLLEQYDFPIEEVMRRLNLSRSFIQEVKDRMSRTEDAPPSLDETEEERINREREEYQDNLDAQEAAEKRRYEYHGPPQTEADKVWAANFARELEELGAIPPVTPAPAPTLATPRQTTHKIVQTTTHTETTPAVEPLLTVPPPLEDEGQEARIEDEEVEVEEEAAEDEEHEDPVTHHYEPQYDTPDENDPVILPESRLADAIIDDLRTDVIGLEHIIETQRILIAKLNDEPDPNVTLEPWSEQAVIADLRAQIKEKDRAIVNQLELLATLRTMNAEKDATIASQAKMIESRERTITTLQQQIKNR